MTDTAASNTSEIAVRRLASDASLARRAHARRLRGQPAHKLGPFGLGHRARALARAATVLAGKPPTRPIETIMSTRPSKPILSALSPPESRSRPIQGPPTLPDRVLHPGAGAPARAAAAVAARPRVPQRRHVPAPLPGANLRPPLSRAQLVALAHFIAALSQRNTRTGWRTAFRDCANTATFGRWVSTEHARHLAELSAQHDHLFVCQLRSAHVLAAGKLIS